MIRYLFFTFMVFTQAVFASSIYDYIKTLPFDPQGWFSNQPQLETIFAENEIESVIELGSFAGRSALFFGEKLKGKGPVFAVDDWSISPMFDTNLALSNIPENNDTSRSLFNLFLSNVKHAGLEEVIIPIRLKTDEAAKILDVQVDLIYVDADHSAYQVEQDILNWYPHLKKGGIMCGDDWGWDSVRKGVLKAAKKLGREVEGEKNFWRFL